ncbi:MAG: hypothetical protein V1838_04790, partial [Patescibacteria group bacterium]
MVEEKTGRSNHFSRRLCSFLKNLINVRKLALSEDVISLFKLLFKGDPNWTIHIIKQPRKDVK